MEVILFSIVLFITSLMKAIFFTDKAGKFNLEYKSISRQSAWHERFFPPFFANETKHQGDRPFRWRFLWETNLHLHVFLSNHRGSILQRKNLEKLALVGCNSFLDALTSLGSMLESHSVSGQVMFLRFCQILGISSGYLQTIIRLSSGYLQAIIWLSSGYLQAYLQAYLGHIYRHIFRHIFRHFYRHILGIY